MTPTPLSFVDEHVLVSAGPASPMTIRPDHRVRLIKRVAVSTHHEARILCRWSQAAKNVHPMGNRLEMGGIAAQPVATEMVQFQRGFGSIGKLPRHTMGGPVHSGPQLGCSVLRVPEPELSVTQLAFLPRPRPALPRLAFLDFRPEPLFRGHWSRSARRRSHARILRNLRPGYHGGARYRFGP